MVRWLALALLGCSGPNEETLVGELRVMALVSEPPELAPGEVTELSATILDPLANGSDVLMWTCTNLGDGCLERELPLEQWIYFGPSASHTVPPEWGAVLTATEEVRVNTWVLACEPGVCPVVEELRAVDPFARVEVELAEALGDPTQWLGDLPMQGVSLASKSFGVSARPVEERNSNPVPAAVSIPAAATPEESVVFRFSVEDAQEESPAAYGYTTGGGFEMVAYDVEEGAVELKWIAPAEAGNTDWVVVFSDGLGGSAVETGTLTVE